ncbi:MAG: type II toxin-antitoxin system RelB/DinJ family antitoxin [Ruminococcus sp.]|uniref:type II toxin-antitoxin system RelB/DinJ family antitoxin n=1 Tax=Ruminococcus sp. TaxID=41978 RepID=UPI003EF9FECD
MSQTVDVNFTLDEDVKKQPKAVCLKSELTSNDAFNAPAKKVCKEKRIPFDVSTDPFYSKSNLEHLQTIISDINSGKANFSEHKLIEE